MLEYLNHLYHREHSSDYDNTYQNSHHEHDYRLLLGYWEPLARFFRGYLVEAVFVHAKIVKSIREMMDLSRTKNDPKDSVKGSLQ
jgi:hypothetical protein